MVFRNLERRPLRTLASVLGVALAGATLLAGRAPYDAFDRLMDIQYRQTQREDFAVAFVRARSAAAREELMRVAGVTRAELVRVAPVRLRHGHHVRTVGINGMEREGALRSLVDIDGQAHALPPEGLVLSAGLAAALEVRVGDTVRADLLEVGGSARALVVTGVLTEVLGANGYMDRRALNRVLREGDVATGAYLSVERGAEASVAAELRRFPTLVGTTSRQATIDYIDLTMARSIAITTSIVVFAAMAIALAVIYNGARVALSERGRELASLRVLGFTRQEVGRMLLGEQAAVTAAGIVAGFAVGFGFGYLLIRSFDGERHRFPFAIDDGSYLFSAAVVFAAAAIAALIVRRRVHRLDLIAVLKTRE
jgi:putative ABC transport system permease protein